MKALMIGAGGIGTHLLQLLISLPFDLTVMDGDIYEEANLTRQLFRKSMVGVNKAHAMERMYKVGAIQEYFKQVRQVEGFDLLICVPDNHLCRILSLEAADEFNIPVVLAGNGTNTANAMYYSKRYKDTYADPRIRHPEMLTTAERERQNSCTISLAAFEQTRLANSVAANLAATLIDYWVNVSPNVDNSIVDSHAPFEHIWQGNFKTIRGMYEPDDSAC